MQKCGFARARSGVAYIEVREPVGAARNVFWRYFASVLTVKTVINRPIARPEERGV